MEPSGTPDPGTRAPVRGRAGGDVPDGGRQDVPRRQAVSGHPAGKAFAVWLVSSSDED